MTMTMTSQVDNDDKSRGAGGAGWGKGGLIGPMSIGDAIGERAEGAIDLTDLRGKIGFSRS